MNLPKWPKSIIIANEITDFLKWFQVGRLCRLPRFDRLTSILNAITKFKRLYKRPD